MNKDNYEDIINLPHYEPKYHTRMTIKARSAQFAPFSALTGYEESVKETARLTDKKIELNEGLKILINNKLQILIDNLKNNPEATFTYFIKDKNKEGGKYINVTGSIKKIDINKNIVVLTNKMVIPIIDIINITSDLFKMFE